MQITDKVDYIEFYPGPVKSCPKEDDEQIFCSDWVKYHYPQMVFFHCVNEGKKTIGQARKDQAKGLLRGVSDCLFLIPESLRGKYPFGAIELKRAGRRKRIRGLCGSGVRKGRVHCGIQRNDFKTALIAKDESVRWCIISSSKRSSQTGVSNGKFKIKHIK